MRGLAPSPLAGIRVLDLGSEVGAYGTKLLADIGADVVMVEPSGGDVLRRRPPLRDGVSGPEASLSFAYYCANKRSVTLDLATTEGLDLLSRLAAAADVVVVSPGADRLAAADEPPFFGWAPEKAVVCAITPFGLTGPYRHDRSTHLVSFALGGSMYRVGDVEGPPLVIPGRQLYDEVGVFAGAGILAALRARRKVGGQLLDLSVHEIASRRDDIIDRYDEIGHRLDRTISVGIPPSGRWDCTDGIIAVACYADHHWESFLSMLDHPGELADPSLADPLVRRERFEMLNELIPRLVAHRSREDLVRRGQAAGLPCGTYNTPAQFIADEQLSERGFFVPSEHPVLGEMLMPRSAIRATPPIARLRAPAPLLGQHNEDVYGQELGLDPEELRRLRKNRVI